MANLEDFEAVDIQHTNDLCMCCPWFHRHIDSRYNPLKQVVIDRFGESISPRSSLGGVQWHVVYRAYP